MIVKPIKSQSVFSCQMPRPSYHPTNEQWGQTTFQAEHQSLGKLCKKSLASSVGALQKFHANDTAQY